MKRWLAWALVALCAAPGCLLVSPLDDAKPEGSSGGAGRAGSGTGNDTNNAGGGNVGGGDGVDFSLFTGDWITKSGTITTVCGGQSNVSDATVGEVTNIGLGTTSDLIVYPGTDCQILLDVVDRTATSLDGQSCVFTDSGVTYTLQLDYFDFIVTDADTSATTTFYSTTTTSTGLVCNTDQTLYYERY